MSAASYSILFGDSRPAQVDETPEPEYFSDLRLDQIVRQVTGEPDPFHLAPLFSATTQDPAVLELRQDVFADLEDNAVRTLLVDFSAAMGRCHNAVRASNNLRNDAQRHRWHLNATTAYCEAVQNLGTALDAAPLRADGLRRIAKATSELVDSTPFSELAHESSRLQASLRAVQYSVWLHGPRITVAAYDGEADYGEQVVNLFARFQQDQHAQNLMRTEDERRQRVQYASSDPVRERIVSLVARLHPDLFAEVAAFRTRHPQFLDPTISLFYRELQFYLRYLDMLAKVRGAGRPTTRPVLRDEPGLEAREVYDLALALRRASSEEPGHEIVGNDLDLASDERRVVITGPNQGGKTTLSRTIGQLHHLAGLGCPVPGTHVALAPPDHIYTHFEREELGHRVGKLEDDLLRLRTILEGATRGSLVILNEIFASTTTADAIRLAQGVLDRLNKVGALYVCVTFLDEIAQLPHTATFVAQVDPDDVTTRTFRVIRAPADGRAYATALATKHGLTYADIRRRVR